MDVVALGLAKADAKKRYPISTRGIHLPAGWDAGWNAAKAAGSPSIAVVGDSITAGVATGSPTPDSILHGYVGRLETLLAAKYGTRAEFYPIYTYGPVSGVTTSVSPFGNWSTGTAAEYPGGVGAIQGPASQAATVTINVPATSPVTGAQTTGLDVFTVDFTASGTWTYTVDGGAPVTVTCSASASGFSGAVLRRTTIALTPGAHTVVLGGQSAVNVLFVLGAAFYYGGTGLSIARQGIASWRAIDYAIGGGVSQGVNGLNSMMPDHIKPWSGIQDANNISGTGFPWRPDLGIVALGLNDSGFGAHVSAYESALARFIHAFRAGKKNASVLLVATANGNPYSDNAPATWSAYDRYKRVMRGLAEVYCCAYLDFDSIWEPDPIAAGLLVSGNPHPTGNGKGAGGGDGHLNMATTIASVL